MSRKKILVINPNSNASVTLGLEEAIAGAKGIDIDFCTMSEGPFGIETNADIDAVVPHVVAKIRSATNYDAFVIACYSDPGLTAARSVTDRPVFGMQESAVLEAITAGGQFGVLALSDLSIERHIRYIRALGFESRLAKELPLNISVDAAANAESTVDRVIAAGRRLVTEYRVNAVILGCAGMAATRAVAQTKLPVPVIEPAQAAVNQAVESLT